jgi:hypothetical protein
MSKKGRNRNPHYMQIQHIPVPVDFSASTHLTAAYTAELAKRFSARITLYHVLHRVLPQLNEIPPDIDSWFVDGKEAAESRLQEIAASSGGKVEDGVPWDGIVKRDRTWYRPHRYGDSRTHRTEACSFGKRRRARRAARTTFSNDLT